MERLVEILRKAVSDGASDIFIVAGGALSYKVDAKFVQWKLRRSV